MGLQEATWIDTRSASGVPSHTWASIWHSWLGHGGPIWVTHLRLKSYTCLKFYLLLNKGEIVFVFFMEQKVREAWVHFKGRVRSFQFSGTSKFGSSTDA